MVIRTDWSTTIGRGHFERCLTLADKARECGVETRFICKPYRGNRVSVLKERGHDVVTLPINGREDVPFTEWQDSEWTRDAEETLEALRDLPAPADWLIVDSYALGAGWETRMRKAARHIMVIDDLANRTHNCDVVLDQNLHGDMAKRYDDLVSSRCQRLLGPQYALLRPEFRVARANLRSHQGSVHQILIFFGGSDVNNESCKALDAVRELDRPDIQVDVILGTTSPNIDLVRAACANLPQARLYCDPGNIAELMATADISIGAAGSTTWERCCLGLPSILIALAMNQESIAQGLADRGLGLYLGRHDSVTPGQITNAVRNLLADGEAVLRLSSACANLVDGHGATRVASALGMTPVR